MISNSQRLAQIEIGSELGQFECVAMAFDQTTIVSVPRPCLAGVWKHSKYQSEIECKITTFAVVVATESHRDALKLT